MPLFGGLFNKKEKAPTELKDQSSSEVKAKLARKDAETRIEKLNQSIKKYEDEARAAKAGGNKKLALQKMHIRKNLIAQKQALERSLQNVGEVESTLQKTKELTDDFLTHLSSKSVEDEDLVEEEDSEEYFDDSEEEEEEEEDSDKKNKKQTQGTTQTGIADLLGTGQSTPQTKKKNTSPAFSEDDLFPSTPEEGSLFSSELPKKIGNSAPPVNENKGTGKPPKKHTSLLDEVEEEESLALKTGKKTTPSTSISKETKKALFGSEESDLFSPQKPSASHPETKSNSKVANYRLPLRSKEGEMQIKQIGNGASAKREITVSSASLRTKNRQTNILDAVHYAINHSRLYDQNFVIRGNNQTVIDTLRALYTVKPDYTGNVYVQVTGSKMQLITDFTQLSLLDDLRGQGNTELQTCYAKLQTSPYETLVPTESNEEESGLEWLKGKSSSTEEPKKKDKDIANDMEMYLDEEDDLYKGGSNNYTKS